MIQQVGKHALGVFQNVDIAVTKDDISLLRQPLIALYVTFAFDVLAAVRFHDQFSTQTNKIRDVSPDRSLSTKLRTAQAPVAQ
jgi:hypothetical protein